MFYVWQMEHTERMTIRIDPQWLKLLDDLRRREEDVPTRAEMIRRLVSRAFAK